MKITRRQRRSPGELRKQCCCRGACAVRIEIEEATVCVVEEGRVRARCRGCRSRHQCRSVRHSVAGRQSERGARNLDSVDPGFELEYGRASNWRRRGKRYCTPPCSAAEQIGHAATNHAVIAVTSEEPVVAIEAAKERVVTLKPEGDVLSRVAPHERIVELGKDETLDTGDDITRS